MRLILTLDDSMTLARAEDFAADIRSVECVYDLDQTHTLIVTDAQVEED